MEAAVTSCADTSCQGASSSLRLRSLSISSLYPKLVYSRYSVRKCCFRNIRAQSSNKNHSYCHVPVVLTTFCKLTMLQPRKHDVREDKTHKRFSVPQSTPPAENLQVDSTRATGCIHKFLTAAIFVVIASFFSVFTFQLPCVAAPLINLIAANFDKRMRSSKWTDHQFSHYSQRLFDKLTTVLEKIEEVKSAKSDISCVKEALKEVKSSREAIQAEVLKQMNSEIEELRKEKSELAKRRDGAGCLVWTITSEKDGLLREEGKVAEISQKIESLNHDLADADDIYIKSSAKISELEAQIKKRENLTYSVAIRELAFIEREAELLVEKFTHQQKQQKLPRSLSEPPSKLFKCSIQKELEAAQRQHVEQTVLPRVVEIEASDIFMDEKTHHSILGCKELLKKSQQLQNNLEAGIRKQMKSFGEEKRFIVATPLDEAVKGFPEFELKWMFGDREVVLPNALRYYLQHGWTKWLNDKKSKLKKNILEDVDVGKQYLAQKQEHILMDRDKIVAKTWYNDKMRRWEMDVLAVPYAVSRKLVGNVCIRHDYGVMYLTLKGDDKEYFINIQEFDVLFEKFGGFDRLYLEMLSLGIPISVHLMWIPMSEWDIYQLLSYARHLITMFVIRVLKTPAVLHARNWLLNKIKDIYGDLIMVVVIPAMEFLVPEPLRRFLGMAWPEEKDQTVGMTWFLKWQSEALMKYETSTKYGIWWYFEFFIDSGIYICVLLKVLHFVWRKSQRLLDPQCFYRDINMRKLRRVVYYFHYKFDRGVCQIEAGLDPIKRVFGRLKRVKNPPIKLRDFAGADSMEEINEVVAFLQNPSAFKEIGARAPRGVLIVGETGTGKTSLALAIAAEAKVPFVEVKAEELETSLWVGQSAASAREMFQAARNVAPVIIFMEDFDAFAGVRGKLLNTLRHDHEALINQFLVELDGFEPHEGVVLIGTARNLKQMDQALQRPGRMDKIIQLQHPTQKEREKILLMAAKQTMNEELVSYVDWAKVAEKTAFLRPIELKYVPLSLEGSAFRGKFLDADELNNYCSWFEILRNIIPSGLRKTKLAKCATKWLVSHLDLTISREDMEAVVDLMEPYGQISDGIEFFNPPGDWSWEDKLPHAVWAAGRGLIALLLPNFDVVDNLWLEPASFKGIGCTKITKAKCEGSRHGNVETRSYLEKKLVFCFGSHVAAQMLLPSGEDNILSSKELEDAQEIATKMVVHYGWCPDNSPAIYCCSRGYKVKQRNSWALYLYSEVCEDKKGDMGSCQLGEDIHCPYHKHTGCFITQQLRNVLNEVVPRRGSKHAYEMAAKVQKLYTLGYDKANKMLCKNRHVLESIVEELLEFEHLAGKDLVRILDGKGGMREVEPFFLSSYSIDKKLAGSSISGENMSATAFLGLRS